ncbi:unnamed protein product [Meganyctiphanes norvegica]|uniref:C2H2-type domain-containing protein n=1 Tax=Meganyctiphanes norvegica TaxID=48144 RepID=A0AAV2SND8_MEGNR
MEAEIDSPIFTNIGQGSVCGEEIDESTQIKREIKDEPGDTSQNNEVLLNDKGTNERINISEDNNTHTSNDICPELGVDVASMVQNLMQSRQPGISPFQCSECDLECPSLPALEFHTKLHVMERIVQSSYELPGIGLRRPSNQSNGKVNDKLHRRKSKVVKHVNARREPFITNPENIRKETDTSGTHKPPDIENIDEELVHQEQSCSQQVNHGLSLNGVNHPVAEREISNKPDIPTNEDTDTEIIKTIEKDIDNEIHTEARLNKLSSSVSGTREYKCPECDYKCTSNSILKLHMVKHSDERPFECSECDSKFKAKNNLKEHMLTHSTSKCFSCTQCDYTCLRKAQLTRHMVTHTGEKRHACPHCDYRCSEKGNLAKHLLIHGDEKPFSCPEEDCDYKCKLKCNLKTHMLKHSGEKPYACHICDYKSIAKGGLTAHMFKHSGERPFLCSVCGNRYALKGDLNVHMRIHTDNKKFKCQQCDYRCFTQQRIDQHMLTHTGEKPHKCDECGFRFTSTSHLKRHKRTHTGDKPYACTECDYRCARNDKLKIHMQSHITGQLKPGLQPTKGSNAKPSKPLHKLVTSNDTSDSMKKSNPITQKTSESSSYTEAPEDDNNALTSHGIFGSLAMGSSQLPNNLSDHSNLSDISNQNTSSQSHQIFHQGTAHPLNNQHDLGANIMMERNIPETTHSDVNYKMYSHNMEYYSLAKRYSHFPPSAKPLWPQGSSSLHTEGYNHQVLSDKLLNTGKITPHPGENLAHISQNYSHTPLTSYPRNMFVESSELSHLSSKIPSTMTVPSNMTDVLRHASSMYNIQ